MEKQLLIKLREDWEGLLKGPTEGSEGEQERCGLITYGTREGLRT